METDISKQHQTNAPSIASRATIQINIFRAHAYSDEKIIAQTTQTVCLKSLKPPILFTNYNLLQASRDSTPIAIISRDLLDPPLHMHNPRLVLVLGSWDVVM